MKRKLDSTDILPFPCCGILEEFHTGTFLSNGENLQKITFFSSSISIVFHNKITFSLDVVDKKSKL